MTGVLVDGVIGQVDPLSPRFFGCVGKKS